MNSQGVCIQPPQKRVLMIAFEFPPSNGASVQRTLSIYNAFAESGWQVDVLSVNTKAYADGNTDGGVEFQPEDLHGALLRPMAYDVQRDFAWRGKYIGCLMSPDRWGLTWVPTAVRALKKHIKTHGVPDIVWSTSPIASVHAVGYFAQKLTGSPWIADYRDPMPYLHRKLPIYQEKPQRWIDHKVLQHASALTFATEDMMGMYDAHYPLSQKRCMVIRNGFLQSNFDKADGLAPPVDMFRNDRFSLYYSGVLYPTGRCPKDVFLAVKRWNSEHPEQKVELVFQGVSEPEMYIQQARDIGVDDDVRFLPKTTYLQSLKNMQSADALLLIQDAQFNNQIPGKVYEYLNTTLPILIKSPQGSATAKQAIPFPGVFIAENGEFIYSALCGIISASRCPQRPAQAKQLLSREQQATQVVRLAAELVERERHLLHNNLAIGQPCSAPKEWV